MVLPDYLRPGLRVVFCGTAVGTRSKAVGHYYAGSGNEFWKTLHDSGLTPILLRPEDDSRVLDFAIGLTDLAKGVSASSDRGLRSHYDIEGFIRKMEMYAPAWIAFHGKTAAEIVSRHIILTRRLGYGKQNWRIGSSQVFIVPSMSGSNRDPRRLEGLSSRTAWFVTLRETMDSRDS
jgi:TDG/mug DNA glycosylase family protein